MNDDCVSSSKIGLDSISKICAQCIMNIATVLSNWMILILYKVMWSQSFRSVQIVERNMRAECFAVCKIMNHQEECETCILVLYLNLYQIDLNIVNKWFTNIIVSQASYHILEIRVIHLGVNWNMSAMMSETFGDLEFVSDFWQTTAHILVLSLHRAWISQKCYSFKTLYRKGGQSIVPVKWCISAWEAQP